MKRRWAIGVGLGLLLTAGATARTFIPPGTTCNFPGPCYVPNSARVYISADVDVTGARGFQLMLNGYAASGMLAVAQADVTSWPQATITFPTYLGPGPYKTVVRTWTQYGWRDSTEMLIVVPVGNTRVVVPTE